MKKSAERSIDSDEIPSTSRRKSVSISLDTISRLPRRDEYNSSHRHVGVALIFSHKQMYKQLSREITNYQSIKSALKSFGFDVRTKLDLTLAELKRELESVANEDHSNRDCLVVVVLSIGVEGKLLAKDAAYPVKCLWEQLLGHNLAGKPKLFFIEAFRGKRVRMAAGSSVEETKSLTVPKTGDIFVFHGVFQYEFSSPRKGNGAVFITCLKEVLEEVAAKGGQKGIELSSLRFAVIRKVSEKYESMCRRDEVNVMRHMPIVVSNLGKDFYLTPKCG